MVNTLERSDDNWRKTQLGRKTWFGGGLMMILNSIFLPCEEVFTIAMAIVIGLVIVAGVYSYTIPEARKK